MLHVPGAKHRAADTVSRHPVGKPYSMVLIDDIASVHICNKNEAPHTIQTHNHKIADDILEISLKSSKNYLLLDSIVISHLTSVYKLG
jgi:predicted choloylglycine hydrolase